MSRLTLLDTIKLRDTTVYSQPTELKNLQVVYGDLTNSEVPCLKLDPAGTLYHVSDYPITSINKVLIDGTPVYSGWTGYTAYQDETGKSIAVIKFDNPQYEKKVSCACKGVLTENGMIDNPARIIRHIFTVVQQYDIDSIDNTALAEFENACMREDIHIALVIKDKIKIKTLLDEIAQNIYATWLIADGRFIMRLL